MFISEVSSGSVLRYAKSASFCKHCLQKNNHDTSPSCAGMGLRLSWESSIISELKSQSKVKIHAFIFPFYNGEKFEAEFPWHINKKTVKWFTSTWVSPVEEFPSSTGAHKDKKINGSLAISFLSVKQNTI